MNSLNKVQLIGRLGRDPEIRTTQSGMKIAHLSIATSEQWKEKETGEKKEKTEWHRVVVLNETLADVCKKYLQKGAMIYIEGQLQNRKWTDQEGKEKTTTEVVLSKIKGNLILLTPKGERQVIQNSFSQESTDENQMIEVEDVIPF